MNIEEYRNLAKTKLLSRLAHLGFEMQGDHLFLNHDEACFALLRVKDKWSNLAQQIRYLAAIRHHFLPDLEGRAIQGFVDHPALYPFKMNPLKLSDLKAGFFRKSIRYTYQSCNLGHYDTVDIDYGEVDPSRILDKIYEQLSGPGLEWFNSLGPVEASKQINENGNNEYIERIWADAYEQHGY